jgi:hypothetical protein
MAGINVLIAWETHRWVEREFSLLYADAATVDAGEVRGLTAVRRKVTVVDVEMGNGFEGRQTAHDPEWSFYMSICFHSIIQCVS